MPKPPARNSKPIPAQPPTDWVKQLKRQFKTGTVKEIQRDGVRYLQWHQDAFPETPREAWERSESSRILQFIELNESETLPHPGELGARIETDNGRLRLWVEIKENTSLDELERRLSKLITWKARLVVFDKKRDPLPPCIQTVLDQIEAGQSVGQVAKGINAWIASQMYEWEKVDGSRRRRIDQDVAGILRCFKFSSEEADKIMNEATAEIRRGKYPFSKKMIQNGEEGKLIPRDGHPVMQAKLKSYLRTWKKKR